MDLDFRFEISEFSLQISVLSNAPASIALSRDVEAMDANLVAGPVFTV